MLRLLRGLRGARGGSGADRVDWGDLRRTTPVSRYFGYDRGQPVDRFYVEGFLERRRADVRGRVMEIGDDTYTRRFGGERVTRSDVLHVHAGNPRATLVGDLASGEGIPFDAFDCMVLTQTLHLVFDVRAAVRTVHRALRPGGVLLVTVPGISQVEKGEWGASWYWGLTPRSLRRALEERFAPEEVETETHGNALSACAFLYGLAAEELRREELEHADPAYPVTVAARARKAAP
ncbi:MAG TPA: methyltransferase domain-containing protein [Longimicrobiaceae bacterium]|jgi:SAM-dependent methyltransferase